MDDGSNVVDKILNGGYEKDIITTIYGPASAGKTCLCILASIAVARSGKKVVYIDTENGFSVERLKQIAPDYETVLKNIMFSKPTRFEEQHKEILKLNALVTSEIGLIVVDTMGSLYRVETGNKNIQELNSQLGKQASLLAEIATKKNIPILVANQV